MTLQPSDFLGIIYGNQNITLPAHMNYGRYFVENIIKFKDKVALINGGTDEKITYGEMAQQIVNTAASLTRMGVKRGEVVAICSENRIEYLITGIAVLYAGGVITFFNTAYSKEEIVHSVNISRPRYVFLSPDTHKTHFNTLKQMRIIKNFFVFGEVKATKFKPVLFKDLAKVFTDINSYRHADFYGKPETALILYSSGTTGLPKGAKLTHLNLIVTGHQEAVCARDIVVMSVIPWCTCMGWLCNTDAMTYGKTIIFLTKFDEKTYLQTIQKYKVGFLLVVPPIIVVLSKSTLLDKYDVSSVEIMHSGGAPLDPDLITEIKIRFPRLKHVLQGYGMTEAAGAITKEQEHVYKQGSVGKVVLGNIVKIVDIESRKILGPNQPGEVCIKGVTLFDGYIKGQTDLDEEGFYKTGDIAYYDNDGFFYIVDRLKELIKYKAWQVSPSELEAILLQHPAVKDVGVIGKPDAVAGEVPTAFVVKQPGSKVTEKEIVDFVTSKVSPWKQLRGGVRFIEEIPKNGSGKILKRILRDKLKNIPSSKL